MVTTALFFLNLGLWIGLTFGAYVSHKNGPAPKDLVGKGIYMIVMSAVLCILFCVL